MIDQSHNLKGKVEAMIQTVNMAQQLFAKAALVDHERLAAAQRVSDLIRAESCLQDALERAGRNSAGGTAHVS
jgi:L-rhamnose isomerase/sugar isomerase